MTNQPGTAVRIDADQAAGRHIPAAQFAPCAEAFVDRRNPNSEGKLNYSFIGAGVAQSDSQVVNISEPHGFNVGGVSLPTDRLNNLHLHFTAEVFCSTDGDWEFIWGNEGENSAMAGRRDVFTIPTWIYRGFLNRGGEDNFMFAVIGADNPGGIIWNPTVLTDAQAAGLRLSAASRVVDVAAGETLPAGEQFIEPMSAQAMASLPTFTPEQMERFIVRWDNLDWRDDALPGDGQLAAVLGHGMTAARHHYPQCGHPHSFSIEWLRLAAGQRTGAWTVDRPLVALVYDGVPTLVQNAASDQVEVQLGERSIYSVPPGSAREIVNNGADEAVVMLVHGGDSRVLSSWDDATLARAAAAGYRLDPDHHLSPVDALAAV